LATDALDNLRFPGGDQEEMMTGTVLEELVVSSEVLTARERLVDYEAAEAAADRNPQGQQELADLRDALVEMPAAVRMLLIAIDRACDRADASQLG
jgi:hypothetical protein